LKSSPAQNQYTKTGKKGGPQPATKTKPQKTKTKTGSSDSFLKCQNPSKNYKAYREIEKHGPIKRITPGTN
jgi:hypothetical protein